MDCSAAWQIAVGDSATNTSCVRMAPQYPIFRSMLDPLFVCYLVPASLPFDFRIPNVARSCIDNLAANVELLV